MACEAVGEEMKMKIAMAKSLKKTHIVVTCNIIPKIKNNTPPVSLMDAPWSLDQKSGNRIKPKLPVKRRNDPKMMNPQLRISTKILITLSSYPMLFYRQFVYT